MDSTAKGWLGTISRVTVLSHALLLSACGGGGESATPPPSPVLTKILRVAPGSIESDTAHARPQQFLTFEYVDGAGQPFRNARLIYQVLSGGTVLLDPSDETISWRDFLDDFTDENGRSNMYVRLGGTAGLSVVEARVPGTSIRATATLTVLPGNLHHFAIAPADTALYVGGQAALRVQPLDQHNNPVADQVTYGDGAPGVATVDPATGIVTGTAIGRSFTLVRSGSVEDTAWTSVVPQGVLAVAVGGYSGLSGIGVVNVDGSGFRFLGPPPGAGGIMPSWLPNGTRIVYSVGDAEGSRLWSTDLDGGKQLLTPQQSAKKIEDFPSVSADGVWIYYSAADAWPQYDVWRLRVDGTSIPERVTPAYDVQSGSRLRAKPSHDGTRIVYESSNGIDVMDVTTRVVTSIGFIGLIPTYSPSGDRIAFVDDFSGAIDVVNADGSGRRRLYSPTDLRVLNASIDWLPNSEWLVFRGQFVLHLVNATSGLHLPLGYSDHFVNAAWKP